MTEKTKTSDFVEMDFTAMTLPGEIIFDTTSKVEAEKAGLPTEKREFKPSVIAIGHKMVIPGFDKSLEGKEIGKNYEQEIEPEQAFGKRFPNLVKMVSLNQFKKQNIVPQKGMQFNLDGQIATIRAVTGGRVLVDFNNPLAGKKVKYKFKIKRKITSQKEKINSLQDYFFRKQFPFEVKEKSIAFKVEKNFEPYIKMMSKPFEDILGMKVEIKIEEKKEASKSKPSEDEHKSSQSK